MSTPTPGPWVAEGYDLRQKHGRMIAYFGPHHTPADEYPMSCRLQDEANAQWVAAAHAELARLRADLERFTGHGLLDCHAICDQRDAAIARAEKAEAMLAEWSVLNLWGGTPEIIHEFIKGQQNRIHYCQDLETELESLRAEVERWQAEAEEMSAQRSHNANQAGILRAEVEQKSNLLVTAIKSAGDQAARAERAEADTARLDWLLDRSAQTYHSYSNHLGGGNYVQYHKDRAAIDAAMKGTP